MNRSPYHLAAHTRPPTSRRRQRSDITGSCVTANQRSVSRQAQHVGADVVNPMVQPTYGAYGSRYLSSRSMGLNATSLSAATGSILQQHTQHPHHDEDADLPMFSHVHPLQQQQLTHKKSSRSDASVQAHGISSRLTSRQNLHKTLLTTLKKQFFKIINNLQNNEVDFLCGKGKRSPVGRYSHQVFMWIVLPMILMLGLQKVGIVPSHTKLFHFRKEWYRLSERSLQNRQCVMNLFVDKQKEDEFNPDWVDPKKVDPKKPTPSVVVEGTHRTKGQLKLINRFISSVADSFRSNIRLKQHVVFLGSRDGGHLAKEALQHWPPRGSYQTQLHVFGEKGQDELEYEYMNEIESRFEKAENHVHLYDWNGNIAGGPAEDDEEEEDDDDGLFATKKKKRRRAKELENSNDGEDGELERDELPEIKNLLFDSLFQQNDEEEEDDDGISEEKRRLRDNPMFDTIIPYMHVDGLSMQHQLDILGKTISLFEDRKVVAVGIEHTPDMDVKELIGFFKNIQYKTFMLGLRQLTRIDNLCDEMLDNVYDHPFLDNPKKPKSLVSKLFSAAENALGDEPTLEEANSPRYPPFFIAMPKGRLQKEEMTIQHMYDLFSGAGGGGQVKTANDRKAPGK